MRDDGTVIALVIRAGDGDSGAWDEIVDRYAPLLWSVCRRYRLSRPDADDAAQGVWLRLIESLPTLRDPAALPGWLITTAHRECQRVTRGARQQASRELPLADAESPYADDDSYAGVDERLVAAERGVPLREAYRQLSPRCRRLLAMLMQDPSPPYADISAALDMPIGSIGPNRARCLDALRRSPALADVIAGHVQFTEGSHGGQRVER